MRSSAIGRVTVVLPWILMMLEWTSLVLGVAAAAADNDTSTSKSKSSRGSFLWLSDLHLDPWYGTDGAFHHGTDDDNDNPCRQKGTDVYGQSGCDAPELLIHDALYQARRVLEHPDFVIVTGDSCRHGNDQLEHPMEETEAMLSNVSEWLVSTFPNTSILPSIGNNDVTPDYYLDSDNATALLTMVTNGLDSLLTTNDEREAMVHGGYFARPVTDTMTVLSLNTIIYSTSHQPDQSYVDDPLGQFQWLEEQLSQARSNHRVVYILGHIPPTVGSYTRHSQLWHDTYLTRYFDILAEYSALNVLQGQLFGHLHSDEFRLVKYDDTSYPLFLASSITPVYGANPSVRVVHYETDTGRLLDYDTYYLDLFPNNNNNNTTTNNNNNPTTTTQQQPAWIQAPSFRESFSVPDLSVASLETILDNLTSSMSDYSSSSTIWSTLLSRQHVHIDDNGGAADDTQLCDQDCRHEFLCTLQSMTRYEYDACILLLLFEEPSSTSVVVPRRRSRLPRILLPLLQVLGVLLLLGGLAVMWVTTQRYLRRRHYDAAHLPNIDDEQEFVVHTTTTTGSSTGSSTGGDSGSNTIGLQQQQQPPTKDEATVPHPPEIS
jgi:sphingomyelin phosphodiesterase acid-like 3